MPCTLDIISAERKELQVRDEAHAWPSEGSQVEKCVCVKDPAELLLFCVDNTELLYIG